MKTKINFVSVFLFLTYVSLHAQTPYYYYYDGMKQYFELDTKHAFTSLSELKANFIACKTNLAKPPSQL